MARGTTLIYSQEIVLEECCNCGITFGMPRDFRKQCLDEPGIGSGKAFFCPNGHKQWYQGKTEAEKERERAEAAEAAERRVANLRALLDQEQAALAASKRSAAAQKAAATRARNRIEKGVCPHPKCHRHFHNVERHIERCHPDFAEAVAKPLALVP